MNNTHTKKTNRRRIALWAFAVMALALVVAGCGNSNTQGSSGNTDTKNSAAAENQAGGNSTNNTTDDKRVVKHAMGETEITGTPQKVVVLTNEGTEALLALGIKPVGAVRSWLGDPWYPHIQDEMEGVTVVGEESQPNLELIAGLKPDLIIGNKMRQEKVYEQLQAIAPTVMSEDLRGNWMSNFKLYAEALGLTDKGNELLAEFDARIQDFKAKAGDKLNETVSVVRFMDGKTRVYHTNTFSGIIFEQLGIARNAMTLNAKDTFVDEITKERLPEVEADRIFYFTYETGDGNASQTEQDWTNDPLWKNLSAVKNGKAYKVDDAIWNTAGGIKAANLMLDDLYKFYELEK
ncbi:iron-siderophore ABC transporter substrate-binding protein [Paenibacillus phoenicis]|uniref:Iron-siderophore ABC transporter substrate-binding protein n=1 Tax=Paenibacillus phoenicis TaxID=554117 RepID=A0ABU5PHR1_9BACL|nr:MULTISPECIES: iron-siderophore ABC transporter substrate-binding protein [Paenibacillus]MCT2193994.1 iron-siderophore ABC transporter substrate-binding protein [Paenibacillus sp. p3-SID1389]MEA3569486.1 iron-siderophore ABC transporter substrate-binding protein [Paenibacillus phoenicis]